MPVAEVPTAGTWFMPVSWVLKAAKWASGCRVAQPVMNSARATAANHECVTRRAGVVSMFKAHPVRNQIKGR